ncbi:hypothetical protein M8C21_001231, partial [Ambrosia artemisiifolia]
PYYNIILFFSFSTAVGFVKWRFIPTTISYCILSFLLSAPTRQQEDKTCSPSLCLRTEDRRDNITKQTTVVSSSSSHNRRLRLLVLLLFLRQEEQEHSSRLYLGSDGIQRWFRSTVCDQGHPKVRYGTFKGLAARVSPILTSPSVSTSP